MSMTDREVLMIAYGALKAIGSSTKEPVIEVIEEHLWPPVVVNVQMPTMPDIDLDSMRKKK